MQNMLVRMSIFTKKKKIVETVSNMGTWIIVMQSFPHSHIIKYLLVGNKMLFSDKTNL